MAVSAPEVQSSSTGSDSRKVKVLSVGIGEENPDTQALIAMEMEDTRNIEFKKKPARKRSMDRIFGKMTKTELLGPDKAPLKKLPRRSLASNLKFKAEDESDGEEDNKLVRMMDLKIGEQDPATNSLVAMEMKDTHKIGFRSKCNRKKSIDRIFKKVGTVDIAHDVDDSKLKDFPRRSLAANFDLGFLKNNESDESDPEHGNDE
jgi:hypothetical protein